MGMLVSCGNDASGDQTEVPKKVRKTETAKQPNCNDIKGLNSLSKLQPKRRIPVSISPSYPFSFITERTMTLFSTGDLITPSIEKLDKLPSD